MIFHWKRQQNSGLLLLKTPFCFSPWRQLCHAGECERSKIAVLITHRVGQESLLKTGEHYIFRNFKIAINSFKKKGRQLLEKDTS